MARRTLGHSPPSSAAARLSTTCDAIDSMRRMCRAIASFPSSWELTSARVGSTSSICGSAWMTRSAGPSTAARNGTPILRDQADMYCNVVV